MLLDGRVEGGTIGCIDFAVGLKDGNLVGTIEFGVETVG